MTGEPLLLLGPDDDVAIATRDLTPGERVDGVLVRDPLPRGHKLAVRASAEGATVRKYGQQIGVALRPIEAGEHDPVSVTGMVAGGVNVVAFTTGRGSVFGCRPVPSLKLATNTPMYERMRGAMDLDCGGIVDGSTTVRAKGEEIFRALLDVASGRKTKSEELGVGGEEFVPWQLGAVL